MKRLNHRFKKGLALLLTLAVAAGLVPAMPDGANEVQAAAANGTGNTPSVSAYATKEQMMDGTFAPDENGNATNIGKLVFGKKSDVTTPQEWYILGKDSGVSGDNTIIFAASPIASGVSFAPNEDQITIGNIADTDERYSLINSWKYPNNESINTVYANHYGISCLRVGMKTLYDRCFSDAEKHLMFPTTVSTYDPEYGGNYTTSDALYAVNVSSGKLLAGHSDDIEIASVYWSDTHEKIGLRSPNEQVTGEVFCVNLENAVESVIVTQPLEIRPASNLNLSSVLFASAATAASSDTAESGTIANGTAMTLRLDGSSKNIGAAIYDADTGNIEVRRGTTSQTVALVVQGKDGANDWYYTKKIDASETINVSAIVSETNTPASIDLSNCKMWLEITDTDGLIYAVNADKEIKQINTTYANKEQLMNSFKPYSDGTAANYGKLVFGKNQSGTAQEWYILGQDTGVSGDNTIIFAASPIAIGQQFNSNTDIKTYNYEAGTGYGVTAGNKDVYANHYGASKLRATLKNMANGSNTPYFTTAEQGLMNPTTVTTKDTRNGVTYTTTDKLYALQGNLNNNKFLWAGTSDSTVLAMNSYWSSGYSSFWLRSPVGVSQALHAIPDYHVIDRAVNNGDAVQPASNLNLSSVLFASAATAALSETAEAETITNGTAMTLRLDGTGKNIGLVTYNTTTGDIKAVKGSTSQTVALVIQGNDGTNDWYYSKKITTTETVNVTDIASATYTPASIDLSACKIWLEITEPSNGMIYAVCADKEIDKINTTYVTKEQLMNSFKPYSDGTVVNYGKLVFGNNSSGGAQEWYILGKDSGVSGDNTIIFAASPMATGQVFEDDWRNNKTYDTSFGVYASNPTDVYPNHYGASDLRGALKGMADGSNTNYFTTAEQGLMNATTVTTQDTKNSSVTYTTADKLYALAADGYGDSYKTIKAGSDNSTVLAMSSYWSRGDWFWLRSPLNSSTQNDHAYYAKPGHSVGDSQVHDSDAVQPASNLNLSSVLFASGATAASSETAEARTIADGTAMTLRMDGSSENIGTVSYNTTTGNITATKGSIEGNVALVVQGRGTVGSVEQDWYYSKQITGTETVNVTAIVSETNTTSPIDLSDCNIWLETTDSTDKMIYAVGATEILSITSVGIIGIETPAANTTLDTEASCSTTGVSSTTPQITWTPSDSTAGYNTSYTASITLTADTGYEFINSTTATVLGNTATSVNKNADGTLTVTYNFSATAKRKITGVTAPTVPTTFTTYYGYDGYDAILSDGSNSELGTQATVTFEETVAPTTEAMDVTWAVANADDAPYDKTPGATNTFRWTIPASEFLNYDAADCANYVSSTGTITGTVEIKNKAATPVNITGTDSGIRYTDAAIDVSDSFDIDTNAGAATYSLVTGADGGTGEGSLNGTTLTVTKTGTFKIKVETLANGIYASGEKIITLTVSNGTIEYTATDYSGTYDGQSHSIRMNVTNPEGTTVTYSTDGTTYGSDNPSFTNAGIYTVYYRIAKDNYTTIEASKTVTINKKSVTITADEQNIIWGNAIDQSDYSVSADGLATGDTISEITLTPSTTALTENGKISISGVKMENASGADVTGNYDIATVDGTLKIAHNTALAPEKIEAVKTKTTYTAGESLNVDDITVKAYYADGYSEEVTDFTTNADTIDMQTVGTKTLTVSYAKNGATKIKDITISVLAKSYHITDGAGSSHTQDSEGNIIIRGDGEFAKFVCVKVDGSVVDESNYTVKEGSTIITLKAAYLNSLSVGNHTIEFVWTDGFANTTFTVNERTPDVPGNTTPDGSGNTTPDGSGNTTPIAPDTGDKTPVALLLALIIGSGLMAVGFWKKKKYMI